MPILSVIIPVYNSAPYLKRCLDSIVNQSFNDFEAIFINDKSTDNSAEILEEYSKEDERIIVLNNEKNVGSAISRNEALDIVKGKYISFIDSDDYIDKKYFECMTDKIAKVDSDIVLNLSIYREDNGRSTLFKVQDIPSVTESGVFVKNTDTIHFTPCMVWARIYKKSFFDKYNLRFFPVRLRTDDVAFNIISTMYAPQTYCFYGEKYHFNIHETGQTVSAGTLNIWDFEHIRAYNLAYDYLKNKNISFSELKLFRVFPFFKVDTKEKFDFYKMFFEKIKDDYNAHSGIYNDLEKYFAESIIYSDSFEDYLKKYNKIVTIGFIQKGKRK